MARKYQIRCSCCGEKELLEDPLSATFWAQEHIMENHFQDHGLIFYESRKHGANTSYAYLRQA